MKVNWVSKTGWRGSSGQKGSLKESHVGSCWMWIVHVVMRSIFNLPYFLLFGEEITAQSAVARVMVLSLQQHMLHNLWFWKSLSFKLTLFFSGISGMLCNYACRHIIQNHWLRWWWGLKFSLFSVWARNTINTSCSFIQIQLENEVDEFVFDSFDGLEKIKNMKIFGENSLWQFCERASGLWL